MSCHFTINTLMLTKNYDCKKVKDEEETERDYKRFKKFDNRDQGPK